MRQKKEETKSGINGKRTGTLESERNEYVKIHREEKRKYEKT